MNTRSTRSTVTFSAPFAVAGYADELPSGKYEVLVDEERIHGLSFEAWRRTGTYLLVQGNGARVGQTEMRATSEGDLNDALSRDQAATLTRSDSEAALSPQENLK